MALLLQHLSAFKVLASPAVLQIIKALNDQGFQTLPNPHLKSGNLSSSVMKGFEPGKVSSIRGRDCHEISQSRLHIWEAAWRRNIRYRLACHSQARQPDIRNQRTRPEATRQAGKLASTSAGHEGHTCMEPRQRQVFSALQEQANCVQEVKVLANLKSPFILKYFDSFLDQVRQDATRCRHADRQSMSAISYFLHAS